MKIQISKLINYVYPTSATINPIPAPLLKRMVMFAMIGLAVIVMGISGFLGHGFIVKTLIIIMGLTMIGAALYIRRIYVIGRVDIMEGIIRVKPKKRRDGFVKVLILNENNKIIGEVSLSKTLKMVDGGKYRFYFSKKPKVDLHNDIINYRVNLFNFLGFEPVYEPFENVGDNKLENE